MDKKIFNELESEIKKHFEAKSKVVYDHDDSMYYVYVFNTEVNRFDEVFRFVESFYKQHELEFDNYIIPMVFTPVQTMTAYPEYAELPEVKPISKNDFVWVLSNAAFEEFGADIRHEDELALAA